MIAKALEIRDRLTFIPALAVDMNTPDLGAPGYAAQRYLLRRAGYSCDGEPIVILTRLDGGGTKAHYDPYSWGDRTFAVAHKYITEHWNELKDGDVVDVEHILGETKVPKQSERLTVPA